MENSDHNTMVPKWISPLNRELFCTFQACSMWRTYLQQANANSWEHAGSTSGLGVNPGNNLFRELPPGKPILVITSGNKRAWDYLRENQSWELPPGKPIPAKVEPVGHSRAMSYSAKVDPKVLRSLGRSFPVKVDPEVVPSNMFQWLSNYKRTKHCCQGLHFGTKTWHNSRQRFWSGGVLWCLLEMIYVWSIPYEFVPNPIIQSKTKWLSNSSCNWLLKSLLAASDNSLQVGGWYQP